MEGKGYQLRMHDETLLAVLQLSAVLATLFATHLPALLLASQYQYPLAHVSV